MRSISISLIAIGIITAAGYPVDDSVGRVVIYFEPSRQPETPCTIYLDRIRITRPQGGIELPPLRTAIKAEDIGTTQVLLADSVVEPGSYHGIEFRGHLAIDPQASAGRNWSYVPTEIVLPLTLTISGGMAETLFFSSRVELPPDTTGIPKVTLTQISRTIPPRTSLAYVSNEGSDDVTVIDRVTGQAVGTIMVGDAPHGLAVARRLGLLFAANTESNTVSVIEIESRQRKEELQLDFGDDPVALCVTEDERFLVCANRGSNSATVFESASLQPVINVPVGTEPVDLAADPVTSRVFVVNSLSDNVTIFDLTDFSDVRTISVGSNPVAIDIDSRKRTAYVANLSSGYLTMINVDDRAVSGWLNMTPSIGDVAVDEFGEVLYCVNRRVGTVGFFVPSLGASVETIRVGKDPQKAVFDPERSHLYVTCRGSDNVYVINKTSRQVVRTIATGRMPYMLVLP